MACYVFSSVPYTNLSAAITHTCHMCHVIKYNSIGIKQQYTIVFIPVKKIIYTYLNFLLIFYPKKVHEWREIIIYNWTVNNLVCLCDQLFVSSFCSIIGKNFFSIIKLWLLTKVNIRLKNFLTQVKLNREKVFYIIICSVVGVVT